MTFCDSDLQPLQLWLFAIPTFHNICDVLGHLQPFPISLQLQPFVVVVMFYNICNLSQHLHAPHAPHTLLLIG